MAVVPACLSHSSATYAACRAAQQQRYASWRCTPARSRAVLARAAASGGDSRGGSGGDGPATAGLLGAAAVAASLSAAAANAAEQVGAATTVAAAAAEQADAAAAAAAAAAATAAASFTPGPVEVGWEIWVGFVAGVVPFIIATVEFSKRIIIQRRCPCCKSSGLVQRGRYLRKCPECGGLLPWLGWKQFFFSTATPCNGGPLLQPRGQTSVFYRVPPPPPSQEQSQTQQAQEQAAEEVQQQEQQAVGAAAAGERRQDSQQQ
ncbi:hypothetical protein ABPG75_007102 [Micractinium tetrahymenae]